MQALAHIKKNSSDLAVVKQLVDQAYARTRTYLRTRTYTFILYLYFLLKRGLQDHQNARQCVA